MSLPHQQPKRIIDLRKHPRLLVPSGALFSFKSLGIPVQSDEPLEGEGALVDLSIGGCRFLSDIPLTIGQEYNLIFQISTGCHPIPVDAAVVRWTSDATYGLKFISIDPYNESRLYDLLLDIRHPTS